MSVLPWVLMKPTEGLSITGKNRIQNDCRTIEYQNLQTNWDDTEGIVNLIGIAELWNFRRGNGNTQLTQPL
jgi:hypothetical protein